MKKQSLNTIISFRLDENDKNSFNSYCLDRNISKSEIFREFSKELLIKIKNK